MRTLTSVALAGVLAIGAISTAPLAADAAGKRTYHHHHTYQPPPDPGAGIVAGAIVGLAVGALAVPIMSAPYAYPPTYAHVPPAGPAPTMAASGNAHMDWCEATYETYDPETNLWVDYRGVPRECVGPY